MGIINRLTADELSTIEKFIDEYAFEDTNVKREVSAEVLLREWDRAKSEYLGDLFGDSLILSKEIEYYEDQDSLNARVDNYLNGLSYNYNGVEKNFYNNYHNKFLSYDIEDSSLLPLRNNMYRLIISEALGKNKYEGDTFELPIPNSDKMLKIQYGCKPMKILGKIAKYYELDGFEKFRIEISQILNQKKFTGELHLSIHPLDYMTSSDNACDWTSCMSWMDEGAYRQGTVEMMNSPMVVVAYLTSKESMHLFNQSDSSFWNNKKWREYIIVTPEIVTDIKGYPYINSYLSKEAIRWLADLMQAHGYAKNYGKYMMTYYPEEGFYLPDEDPDKDNEHVLRFKTNYMYNDFSSSRVQYAIMSRDLPERKTITYSGESECMSCGALNIEIPNESCLVGNCCAEYRICDECGDTIDDVNEQYYWVDDRCLCQDCFDNYCSWDPIEEEYHYTDNMTRVYLGDVKYTPGSPTYDSYACVDLSNYSLHSSWTKNYFKRLYKANYSYIIDIHDVTPLGWDVLFGYNSLESYLEHNRKDTYSWGHSEEHCYCADEKVNEVVEIDKIDDMLGWHYGEDRMNVYYYDLAA